MLAVTAQAPVPLMSLRAAQLRWVIRPKVKKSSAGFTTWELLGGSNRWMNSAAALI